MDSDFWSWFAGFWEGEGAIGCYKDRQVEICACQKTPAPLVYIRENTEVGKVVPDYEGGKIKLWRWRTRSRPEILKVGRRLLPYLRFRRGEMETALSTVQEMEDNRHWNGWTDDELTFLKENYDKVPPKEIPKKLPRHT